MGGELIVPIGTALLIPESAPFIFAADSAEAAAERARRQGLYGTPRADVAIRQNAAIGAALGALKLEYLSKPVLALAGRLAPSSRSLLIENLEKIASDPSLRGQFLRTVGKYGWPGAQGAVIGAVARVGQNAVVKTHLDPSQRLSEGAAGDSLFMAGLNVALSVLGHGRITPAGPSPKPGPVAPDGRAALRGIETDSQQIALPRRDPQVFGELIAKAAPGAEVRLPARAFQAHHDLLPLEEAQRLRQVTGVRIEPAADGGEPEAVMPLGPWMSHVVHGDHPEGFPGAYEAMAGDARLEMPRAPEDAGEAVGGSPLAAAPLAEDPAPVEAASVQETAGAGEANILEPEMANGDIGPAIAPEQNGNVFDKSTPISDAEVGAGSSQLPETVRPETPAATIPGATEPLTQFPALAGDYARWDTPTVLSVAGELFRWGRVAGLELAVASRARTSSSETPVFGDDLRAHIEAQRNTNFGAKESDSPGDLTEALGSFEPETQTDADLSDGLDQIYFGPYGRLSKELKGSGLQAHHLNQNSAFKDLIPPEEGLAIGLKGNVFTEQESPHHRFHSAMDRFWEPYRKNSDQFGWTPASVDYGIALEEALIQAGLRPEHARIFADLAAAQRAAHGLKPEAVVPRVPRRTTRRETKR